MTGRNLKPDHILNQRKATSNEWAIGAALEPLDRIARETEARWGATVLESLADPETAAKFGSARQKLNDAIERGDFAEVSQRAAIMERGWKALELAAIARGHSPGDVGRFWHVTADSGRRYVIVQHETDMRQAAKAYPDATVWAMSEVVRILEDHSLKAVLTAKGLWPGAAVVDVRRPAIAGAQPDTRTVPDGHPDSAGQYPDTFPSPL